METNEINLYDMLTELSRKLESYENEIDIKFKDVKETPQKQVDLFSITRGEINLSKTCTINVIKSVRELINSLRNDVSDNHTKIVFTEGANGEFFKKHKAHFEEMRRLSAEQGKYEHRLYDSLMKNVNSDMVDTFNKSYVNVSKNKYFKEFKKGRNGDTDKKWLLEAIYNHLCLLPKRRMIDCYDREGDLLGMSNVPFDESEKYWNSVLCDVDGNSVFTFHYAVDKNGWFKFARVAICGRYFELFKN